MISRKEALKIISCLPFTGLVTGGLLKSAKISNNEDIDSAPVVSSKDKLYSSQSASIYDSIGVRPVINARGTVTIIGACRMLPEVKQAMDEATRSYVQLDELMDEVSVRLGELTGAEAGCVTSGASAAITLSTAAAVTDGDPDKMWKIPDLSKMKNEVIIPSYSVTAYAAAIRSVGAKVIIVSNYDELKSALGPRTAMIYVLAGSHSEDGPMSLEKISPAAKSNNVPILVDAAAEGLYLPNPHLAQGADLVAYSGGKYLQGPQCSGLLIGRKDLVHSAWIAGAPHHGPLRGYKVGREEIMGLYTAVETWFKRDHDAEMNQWTEWLKHIVHRLKPVKGVHSTIRQPHGRSNHSPSLLVEWDQDHVPFTGDDVERLLWDDNPRVAVSGAGSFLPFPPNESPHIRINSSQMKAGEEKIVADRVFSVLSDPSLISKLDNRNISLAKDQGMSFAFWPLNKTSNKSAPAFDISGEWDLHMKFAVGTVKERVVFEQKGSELLGTHVGGYGARELFGKIHGHDILFRSSFDGEFPRLNFTFTGKLNNGTMEGRVSMGEHGMASWRAKRHKFTV